MIYSLLCTRLSLLTALRSLLAPRYPALGWLTSCYNDRNSPGGAWEAMVTRPGRWLALLALFAVLPLVGCADAAASAPAPTPLPIVVPTAVPSPRPVLRIAFSERYGGNTTLWVA